MANIDRQLAEDRELRKAAKQLVKGDVDRIKANLASGGVGKRAAGRAKDGAAEIAENAGDFVSTHRAQIGGGLLVGALALAGWLFRDQITAQITGAIQTLASQDDALLDEHELDEDELDDEGGSPQSLIEEHDEFLETDID